jgi:HSP20 family molecular chaperone IbpA
LGASDKVQPDKSENKGLTGLIGELAKLTENSETYQKRIKLGEKGVIDFHIGMRPLKGSNSTRQINSFKLNKFNEEEPTHLKELAPIDAIKENDSIVDVFEEGQTIRVMAELPGASENDVKIDIESNTLIIRSTTDSTRKYYKRIALPKPVTREAVEFSCKNGVLEVKLKKVHND